MADPYTETDECFTQAAARNPDHSDKFRCRCRDASPPRDTMAARDSSPADADWRDHPLTGMVSHDIDIMLERENVAAREGG
jgi:hypothetical protein